MRTQISETKNKAGETVQLFGWVHTRRDHGKIIFIDLRDRSGLVQIVFTPGNKGLYEKAESLRSEWVIKVVGKVAQRPEAMINKEVDTGEIEVQPESMEILSESATPPFALDTDGMEIGEDNRMKYRYLDLRRFRMRDNLILRHKIIKFIRDYLDKEGFIEVETPILTKSTPEGARDYVVPSRLYPGKFFALPQSPQQYKQLLMVAGVEKYFQIARCFRDEDTRGDRQPEFTQLDLEMSFVAREDVIQLNEALLIELVQKMLPAKKIQEIPFPRLSYKEAMEKYGTDRPDLRQDTHNPFSAPKPEHFEMLLKKEKIGEILTSQYDVVLNGSEIGGGSIRSHQEKILKSVFEIMGFSEERINKNFGHMLESFSFGAPPHGGIAWGLDRLVNMFSGEPNIREVIAFPKTGDARDLMMDSPSEIEGGQLKELHLSVKNE